MASKKRAAARKTREAKAPPCWCGHAKSSHAPRQPFTFGGGSWTAYSYCASCDDKHAYAPRKAPPRAR